MPRLLLVVVVVGGPKKQSSSASGDRACTQRGEDVQSGACIDPCERRFSGGEKGLHVVRAAAAAAGRVGRGLRWRRRENEMVHKLEAWSLLLTTGPDMRGVGEKNTLWCSPCCPIYVLLSMPRVNAPPRVDAPPAFRSWRRKRKRAEGSLIS